jgi:hypothetical protein
MPDHVHMLISIPPKYSVAEVIGYLKGKFDLDCAECGTRNFLGHKFWAMGYFVSTVGRYEEMIRAYIRNQEWRTSSWISCNSSSRPHEVPSLVLKSFITASGGSPSNPQLCWGVLAAAAWRESPRSRILWRPRCG